MLKYMCIFALWIGWSSYQPIRGTSIAPSTSLMIDVTKKIGNMPKKKSLIEVKSSFQSVWGERFIYEHITDENYINTNTKVPIECRKHGIFWQTPHSHISGIGCPICGRRTFGMEEAIKRVSGVHNGKYDYSLITQENYIDTAHKVPILCNNCHNVFYQTLRSHFSGQGCPTCAARKRAIAQRGKRLYKSNLVFGVGKNDSKKSIKEDGKQIWSYTTWMGMLERCYSKNILKHTNRYKDCIVCKEWLNFSNFQRWAEDATNGYKDGYQLDKDIIVKGNKVYSPNTCCFVPREINSLIINCKAKRGNLPIGVSLTKRGKYLASHAASNFHKTFYTPDEAFVAYKSAKELYIQKVATNYFNDGKITERVYKALLNYKIEIID